MNIQRFPSRVVRTGLRAARLPLGLAEQVARRDSATWAPAVAFDTIDAGVRQLAGTLLRDEDLAREGRLQQAKVEELRRASRLETFAEQQKLEAEGAFRERLEQDAERRRKVEEQAARREQEIERSEAAAKQQAAMRANQKAASAAKAEQATKKALAKQERAAKLTRIEAEREALADQRAAVAAEEQVIDLDKAIETTKAVRKARR